MTDTLEPTAQRIADRGRDALLARLRPAFKEAASAHSDVLELSDEQLEQMAQRAADRADGLQWRRALATVATEELDIGLVEALSHPAVARAQEIVGAPSYEESLEALAARRPTAPSETDEAEAAEAAEAIVEAELTAEAESIAEAGPLAETERDEDLDSEDEAPEPDEEPLGEYHDEDQEVARDGAESIRVAVIHLGGVANLSPGERDIELEISGDGLDILRGSDETLGRLSWGDIRTLSVPPAKGMRRRWRENRAHLVVRTETGDASFEVPAVAPDELRAHLAPVVERQGRAVEAG